MVAVVLDVAVVVGMVRNGMLLAAPRVNLHRSTNEMTGLMAGAGRVWSPPRLSMLCLKHPELCPGEFSCSDRLNSHFSLSRRSIYGTSRLCDLYRARQRASLDAQAWTSTGHSLPFPGV